MQTPAVVLNIGVDVAKDEIVVACSESSFPVRQIANQRVALLAFLKNLPTGSRIGVESTGSYHELFAEAAHQLGFAVFLLNPKDTRHYAKAVGLRGKTDRVDAELIARMIAHEHTKLHAWIPPTPQQREMDRLIKRRATLVALREAVEMSLHELDGFAVDLKALRTRFNQLIARLDLRVKALVEADPERKQNFARLCTISGVGPVIGTALVNTLERVPLKSADAFVAFTGLDPRPMTRGGIVANAASPSADRPNCAGCSTWLRCRQLTRRRGGPSTNTTGQRVYRAPQPSSSLLGASLVLPGQSIPTRPNSIPGVS